MNFITYSQTQGSFSVNPTDNAQSGTYTLLARVTDNDSFSTGSVLKCEDYFTVTINKSNSPCTFDSVFVDKSIYVESSSTYNLPNYSDLDANDVHTVTGKQSNGSALPSWITVDTTNFEVDYAPNDNSQVGDWHVKITVTDNDAYGSGGVESCTDTFKLTVKYFNHFPSFAFSHSNWVCSVYTNVDYNLPGMNDEDSTDVLTRHVDQSSGIALPSFVSYDAGANKLTCSTSDNDDSGTYTIRVRAVDNDSQSSDQGARTTTETFTLTVNPVNTAPTWGSSFSASYSVDVYQTLTIPTASYSDVDSNDSLTITCKVGASQPSWISSCTQTSITITGHTNANANTYTVDIEVKDDDYYGSGVVHSITASFSLTIVAINRTPTWGGVFSDQSVDVYASYDYTLPTWSDLDTSDTLTLTIVEDGSGSLPGFMSYAAGILHIDPTNNSQGGQTYTIRATISDNNSVGAPGGVESITDTFDVTINIVNLEPSWDQTPVDMDCDVYQVCSYDIGSFTDADGGDTHNIVVTVDGSTTLPAFIIWDEATTTFTFQNQGNDDLGDYNIVVTVTDDDSVGAGANENDQFVFKYEVIPVNSAPTFDSTMNDHTVQVDDVYNYPISAISDIDPNDIHTYSVVVQGTGTLPYFMSFTQGTLLLDITPDKNDFMGNYIIEVMVDDDNSVLDPNGIKSIVATFTVSITPLNHPCVLNTVGIVRTGYFYILGDDQAIDLPTQFTDQDTNDVHRWEFYTGAGTFMDWVFSFDSTDPDTLITSKIMYLDLDSAPFKPKIGFPVPWTIEARLYDDDAYGSGIEEYCSLEYQVKIYPRFYYKREFDDESCPVNEVVAYFAPSYYHDDPDDDLVYKFTLMNGEDLPDFMEVDDERITLRPTLETEMGIYQIVCILDSEKYVDYYPEHMGDFVITITEPEEGLASDEDSEGGDDEDSLSQDGDENDENYVSDTIEAVTSAISNEVTVNPEFSLRVGEDPLDGQIIDADQIGRLKIYFTKKMQVVKNLRLFKMAYGNSDQYRKLQEGDESIYQGGGALLFQLDSSELRYEEAITDWYVEEMDSSSLSIAINYTRPLLVSASQNQDTLYATVVNPSLFVTEEGEQIEAGTEFKTKVPPQIDSGDVAGLTAAAEAIESVMESLAFANVGLNIFMATSLQLIWKMLASLQLIVHLPLLAVQFPANARLVLSLIVDLANFKIVNVDWLLESVLGLSNSVSNKGDSSASQFGYTGNFAQSLGLIFVFFLLLLIGTIAGFLAWKFLSTSPMVKKILIFLANKILFNTFIRTFIQGFIGFTLASFMSIDKIDFNSFPATFESIFTVIFACLAVITPAAMTLFLFTYQNSLDTLKFKNRCWSLYLGLKHKKTLPLLYYPFFVTRRLIVCSIIVFMSDWVAFQVLIFMATSVMMAVYALRSQPFHQKAQNRLDVFNEICISLMSYLTICFTDYVLDSKTKYQLGWWAIIVFLVNLGVNILYILYNVIRVLVKACYKKCRCCKKLFAKKEKKTKKRAYQPQESQDVGLFESMFVIPEETLKPDNPVKTEKSAPKVEAKPKKRRLKRTFSPDPIKKVTDYNQKDTFDAKSDSSDENQRGAYHLNAKAIGGHVFNRSLAHQHSPKKKISNNFFKVNVTPLKNMQNKSSSFKMDKSSSFKMGKQRQNSENISAVAALNGKRVTSQLINFKELKRRVNKMDSAVLGSDSDKK